MTAPNRTSHLLRAAIRAGRVVLCEWTPSTGAIVLSNEWTDLLGLDLVDLPTTTTALDARLHPDDVDGVRRWRAECRAHPERDIPIVFRIRRPDGTSRDVEGSSSGSEAAAPSVLVSAFTDATERAEAAGAARSMASLLEALPDFLARFDASGRITYVSPAIALADGRAGADVLGCTIVEGRICPEPSDDRVLHESILRVVATGRPETIEMASMFGDAARTFEVRHVPVRDDAGAVTGVIGISTDITERKSAEARLRVLNAALDTVPDAIFLTHGASPLLSYANQSAADALGYTREELAGGMSIFDIDPSLTPEAWNALVPPRRAARVMRIESTHRAKDGRLIPVEVTGNFFEHEGTDYNIAVVRDISDRKASDAALRSSEAGYRTLTEHSPDLILRVDASGRYLYANHAFEALSGLPASAHIGRTIGDVSGNQTEQGARAFAMLKRAVAEVSATRRPFEREVRMPRPDGDHIYNVRLVPEFDESGAVTSILVVARDITERELAAEALRSSEQRFRQVTEAIDEVFWLNDVSTGVYIYLSPAFDRVFGRPRESLYEDPSSWLTLVHPDDLANLGEALRATPTDDLDLEYRIVTERGERWIHERAFPIRDRTGQVYRVAGVAEDATIRRTLEEQLLHSQKMEAVGQLAGGIAHDFNNLLAVIQMQSSLLLEDGPQRGPVAEGLREIQSATERAANLTRQLLLFSRRQVAQPVDLDVSEVVGTMTKLLRRLLGEDVALETRFSPGLPLVHADRSMLEQVLMNLAINARDAMPAGGRLVVGLDALEVDAEAARLRRGVAPGPFIRLTVSDTGCGIPESHVPRIFEPFFTTKGVGKGTGLGLATVFGIVQQHQGWIEVDSLPGQGTTFSVFLPAATLPARGETRSERREAVDGGTETILLVEDEDAVRTIARTTLERFGYTVIEAQDAAQALATWQTVGARVDLLLTDLIMPGGVSGRELAERVLADRPRLPVIYTTGYSPDVVDDGLKLDERRTLLQKPFSAVELAHAVRRSIDAAMPHAS
jgi:PAS domain S-box-containing protein